MLALVVWSLTLALPVWGRLIIPSSVTLGWNPVDGDIAGYNVYYGTASGVYSAVLSVGNTNQARITGLSNGVPYFFAITSLTTAGLESPLSAEIIFTPVSGEPVLNGMPLPNGGIALASSGLAGHSYDMLATEDFVTWKAVGNVAVAADGWLRFSDPQASLYRARFYRLHETTFVAPGSVPMLDVVLLPLDGQIEFDVHGLPGHSYDILNTEDSSTWTAFANVTADMKGSTTIIEPFLAFASSLSYQLVDTTFTAPGLPTFQIQFTLSGVDLQVTGLFGHAYQVLTTDDLRTWNPIGTVTVPAGGVVTFHDPTTSVLGPLRVYRLKDLLGSTTPH